MGCWNDILLLSSLLIIAESVFVPELIQLPVGQPFRYTFQSNRELRVQDASGEDLPSWLTWMSSQRILEGVPQFANVGEAYIRVTEDKGTDSVMELRVSEEMTNPCGEERKTVWMELAFDMSLVDLDNLQQLELIDSIAQYTHINSSLMRLYTNHYKDDIRRLEVVEDQVEGEPNPDDATLLWKVACDDLDDDATEVLETVLNLMDEETELPRKPVGWRLTKGSVLSRKQRREGASGGVLSQFSEFATNEPDFDPKPTSTPTTTTRVTRSTRRMSTTTSVRRISASRSTQRGDNYRTTTRNDNPPVRLNSLPTFHCNRGSVCELVIPEKTFMDPEDGDTRALSLSVYPIVAEKNWLTVDHNRQILRGIPLNQGDFEFRLEARDSAHQMTSAAFRVSVAEAAPSNHLFVFDMQKNYAQLLKDPTTLLSFATKLGNALGDRFPNNVLLRSVEAKNNERTYISWSNSSLSHKICQKKAIDALKYQMLTRRRDRIRNEFLRAMDSRFHVRDIKLELRDSCMDQAAKSVSVSDVEMSTSPEPAIAALPSLLWVPVVLGLLFLLLLLVLVLICCAARRRNQKTVQSEFVSKGMPVVFPEEIPQEDDSATVATPMLVREERPPLLITTHENHLYKPPPPLASTSSPRPRSSATNQRLPPPYVPP